MDPNKPLMERTDIQIAQRDFKPENILGIVVGLWRRCPDTTSEPRESAGETARELLPQS